MAKHEKAFSKETDADKLAATSEQYQEQTGQGDVETGPDPIVEATEKAAKDADVEPTKDQAERREELDEEQEKAWESTPPSEPEGDAESRAKDEEKKAKDSEAAKQS